MHTPRVANSNRPTRPPCLAPRATPTPAPRPPQLKDTVEPILKLSQFQKIIGLGGGGAEVASETPCKKSF